MAKIVADASDSLGIGIPVVAILYVGDSNTLIRGKGLPSLIRADIPIPELIKFSIGMRDKGSTLIGYLIAVTNTRGNLIGISDLHI
jgi:hypothetical protein